MKTWRRSFTVKTVETNDSKQLVCTAALRQTYKWGKHPTKRMLFLVSNVHSSDLSHIGVRHNSVRQQEASLTVSGPLLSEHWRSRWESTVEAVRWDKSARTPRHRTYAA